MTWWGLWTENTEEGYVTKSFSDIVTDRHLSDHLRSFLKNFYTITYSWTDNSYEKSWKGECLIIEKALNELSRMGSIIELRVTGVRFYDVHWTCLNKSTYPNGHNKVLRGTLVMPEWGIVKVSTHATRLLSCFHLFKNPITNTSTVWNICNVQCKISASKTYHCYSESCTRPWRNYPTLS